jgi:hypothetical protein
MGPKEEEEEAYLCCWYACDKVMDENKYRHTSTTASIAVICVALSSVFAIY